MEAVKSLVEFSAAQLQQIDAILDKIKDTRRRDECCCEAAQYAAQRDKAELVAHLAAKISDPNMMDRCLRNILFNTIAMSQLDFWEKLQLELRNIQQSGLLRPLFDPRWLLEEERLLYFLATCAVSGKLGVLEKLLTPVQGDMVRELLAASISAGHVALALNLLSRVSDINGKDETGTTALMLASERGHDLLIQPILDKGASVELEDNEGRTALSRAYKEGHMKVVRSLIGMGTQPNPDLLVTDPSRQLSSLNLDAQPSVPQVTLPDDDALSSELHQILSSAGFTAERARCLQAMADSLELAAQAVTGERRTLTGSYAEGWANSLTQLNGRTDADSDIDWTILVDGMKFHLVDGCQCPGISARLHIEEGHAQLQVDAGSQPAVRFKACGVRPALDTCYAFPCCSSFCQQRVRLLQAAPEHVHLVRATRPNKTSELRVSFSFHEKEIMRRLSTVQGQLFVLLKCTFKSLLPSTGCPGMKTYHAKSLLFYMLHKHPTESGQWQASNLIKLLKEALDLMLEFLEDSKNSGEVCMPHFFMPDAPLYFKNCGVSDISQTKSRVRDRLAALRRDLAPLVIFIRESVQPLQSEQFFFHPFTLMPLSAAFTEQQVRGLWLANEESHLMQSAYCLVHQILLELDSDAADMPAVRDKLFILDSLPDFCCCAVICLKVMTQLKLFNKHGKEANRAKAEQLLRDSAELRVRSGLPPADIGQSRDWFADSPSSAFRFCFPCRNRPLLRLSFLPEFSRRLIVVRLSDGRSHHLYVNFRCLLWSLQAELLGGRPKAEDWVELARQDPDWSELAAMGHYCSEAEQLRFCLDRMEVAAKVGGLGADEAQMLQAVRNKVQQTR